MQTYNTYFESKEEFSNFVQVHELLKEKSLLVQVFTSEFDKEKIVSMRDDIIALLPQASLIGATTDGEINGDRVTIGKTVVSISKFEHTEVSTKFLETKSDSFTLGEELAHISLHDNSKVMIILSDGLHINGEELLLGVNSVNSEVVIAGGMASDGARFIDTFVFTESEITNAGAVCAVLDSDELHIFNSYNCNWERIGKAMRITKAESNRVYTIDNQKAEDVYRHYLGDSAADALPAIGIEFPLMIKRNGIDVARAVLVKEDDGSLVFAGNLVEGDEVYFGFGNVDTILKASQEFEVSIADRAVESLFIYSCMARRHFLQDEVVNEIAPLSKLAPTSGFFTYGEFFKAEGVELLNQTMTVLALSEFQEHKIHCLNSPRKAHSSVIETQKALTHLIKVTSDELKELNENLEKKVEQKTTELEKTIGNLERATKVKSDFLANMSHEIRTPLNAIIGFSELLRQGEHDSKRLKKFKLIDSSSKELLHLIDEILDITKIESRELEIKLSPFNIVKLLKELKSHFSTVAKKRSITLEFTLDKSLPKKILSDSRRLKQVVENLLSNAVKFTPEGGSVALLAKCTPHELIIEVEDSGCGISEDKIKTIFQTFNQSDNSSTRRYGGAGLGLSIANELSHLLNGRIDVESRVGRGSKFSLILPCSTEQQRELRQDEEDLTFEGRVLLVEDNLSNQMLMELLFEEVGLKCDIAADGLEGVQAFKGGRYDIIFMDENMPKLSGSEAAKIIFDIEVNESLEHTPMVALSANALKGDKERFLEVGMDEYLSKPIDFRALKSILAKYLKQG